MAATESLMNAFEARFLAALDEQDEPAGAREAELDATWRVEALSEQSFGVFREGRDGRNRESAYAVFRHREDALLAKAVLPALGREPYFLILESAASPVAMRLGVGTDGAGFRVVGEVSEWYPEFRDALQIGAYLARHPEALAAVLEAAGPRAVAALGEILARHLEEGARS